MKHARFLQIEQGSAEQPPESESADRARIAAVLAAAPASAAPAGERLEIAADAPAGDGAAPDWTKHPVRMLDVPAEPAAEIAIDEDALAGQPFVRCVRCGADSSLHATSCENCGERLDTAEHRAFNDRLWETRLRQNAEERAALEVMAAARYENAKKSSYPLPYSGATLPEELRRAPEEEGPILLAALLALQQPRWRWTAGALVVVLPLVLVTLGGAILAKIGWFLLVLLMLSLLPRRLARRLFEAWAGFRRR